MSGSLSKAADYADVGLSDRGLPQVLPQRRESVVRPALQVRVLSVIRFLLKNGDIALVVVDHFPTYVRSNSVPPSFERRSIVAWSFALMVVGKVK